MSEIAIFRQLTIETAGLPERPRASIAAHPVLSLHDLQADFTVYHWTNDLDWDTGRVVTYGMHNRETILHCSAHKWIVEGASWKR